MDIRMMQILLELSHQVRPGKYMIIQLHLLQKSESI